MAGGTASLAIASPSQKNRSFSLAIASPSKKNRSFSLVIASPSKKNRSFSLVIASPSKKYRSFSLVIASPTQERGRASLRLAYPSVSSAAALLERAAPGYLPGADSGFLMGEEEIDGQVIAADQGEPTLIVADDVNVYWTDFYGGNVVTAPAGGGALSTLASNQQFPYAIAIRCPDRARSQLLERLLGRAGLRADC
jgi:hypothetical protein